MIIDLPSTTTAAVTKKLIQLREDVGSMALGRVLTLVIVVDELDAEVAIEAANDASHQHPCRIITVVLANKRGSARLDAQIRVGGDAGASEVVVMRLYGPLIDHGRSVVIPLLLPDSPVVAWWPKAAPPDVSADPIGAMAQRRITDAAESPLPLTEVRRRAKTYADGDTDLAWTRITLWRGLLAAALDQPPYEPVVAATVTGGTDSASTDLLAAWLANTLRCPVTRARSRVGSGMQSVRLERKSGNVDLVRPEGSIATLTQPGQPDRRISLARRQTAECLADELRRLDPDDVYRDTIVKGLPKILGKARTKTASEAVAEGEAPSAKEAERRARAIQRRTSHKSSSAMVEAEPPPPPPSTTTVKKAAAKKLAATRTEREKPGELGEHAEPGGRAEPGERTQSAGEAPQSDAGRTTPAAAEAKPQAKVASS
ncbi:MAG TPA: glucose-6-phosphate dehydrogenase assembly protein OpcA [Dermatophilaceae bacterium]|nr:glucose-6-phosphate dehydrogenase assembly protein OpcA [Dermatophilaceae bacterium]